MSLSSPRCATGQYRVENAPYGLCLTERYRGCMAVMGFIFFVPGLFILTALLHLLPGVKTPDDQSGEWYAMFGLGLAFVVFGLAMAFYKRQIEIDTQRREFRVMKGLFTLNQEYKVDMSVCEDMVITREIDHGSESNDQVIFPLTVRARNGHNFLLGHYMFLEDALRVGLAVAGRTGLKLYDSTAGAQREMTQQDLLSASTAQVNGAEAQRFSIKGVSFEWDRHEGSLSRLYTATANGVQFYRVDYPRAILPRLFVFCVSVGFMMHFFGWRLDKIFGSIIEGFTNPQFMTSVEVFFTTIMVTVWVMFLFLFPLISLCRAIFMPPNYNLIGLSTNGLYLEDRKGPVFKRASRRKRYMSIFLRYADIKGIDVKAVAYSQRKWIWNKINNHIALRAGVDLYEIGAGLDVQQLDRIATDIRRYTA